MSSQDIDEIVKVTRDKAITLLTRREYSRSELFTRLIKLADEEIVDAVLLQLEEQGLQSDLRFTEMLCKARYNAGKGPVFIRNELDKHGIDSDIVEQCMLEYANSWSQLAYEVRRKKFGEAAPADYKTWAKQARFLMQRGFTAEHFGYFDNSSEEI